MKMTNKLANALITLNENLKPFLPRQQLAVLTMLLQGEEGDWYADKVQTVAKIIEDMPKTGDENEGIVYLHYFMASSDAWIIEKDIEGGVQQAFGWAVINGGKSDAEMGYISISEWVENGAELDLHFPPRPWLEIR